ncbi:hypothetical protein AB0C24_25870 [Amycolatopsis japonica]|uniref:hypothetical protein n=1 Tax=Amycolatopsis japonica TaxID=208439 RepID=UPI00340053C0
MVDFRVRVFLASSLAVFAVAAGVAAPAVATAAPAGASVVTSSEVRTKAAAVVGLT